METTDILYGTILALFLAMGDHIAIDIRRRYGRNTAILAWLIMVATPIVVALLVNYQVLKVALPLGILLSLALYLGVGGLYGRPRIASVNDAF